MCKLSNSLILFHIRTITLFSGSEVLAIVAKPVPKGWLHAPRDGKAPDSQATSGTVHLTWRSASTGTFGEVSAHITLVYCEISIDSGNSVIKETYTAANNPAINTAPSVLSNSPISDNVYDTDWRKGGKDHVDQKATRYMLCCGRNYSRPTDVRLDWRSRTIRCLNGGLQIHAMSANDTSQPWERLFASNRHIK